MNTPQLFVWVGSPDDKLDVMRYVNATNKDILNQPVVQNKIAELKAERDALRARVEELEER